MSPTMVSAMIDLEASGSLIRPLRGVKATTLHRYLPIDWLAFAPRFHRPPGQAALHSHSLQRNHGFQKMADDDHENQLPKWMSITGQPLQLGLDSGFKGRHFGNCQIFI